MFAPAVIGPALDRLLASAPGRRAFPSGAIPEYSIADSHAYTKQLAEAYDEDDTPIRPLDRDEQQFVATSLLRSQADYRYWAERFVWIDQGGQGVRPLFPLWESQAFILDTLATLEADRAAADAPDGLLLNVLKARQLGISTLGESILAHRLFYVGYTRGLCGADVEDQAGYLFRMVDRIYQRLPAFMRHPRKTFVKNREMTFGNGSYLKTAWGKSTRGALQSVTGQEGSKGAIGRGQTFSVVHISELATWDNPEQLDSALFPAIPMDPSTFVLLESTAEYAGDWWHLHWQTAAEGHGRFVNAFIPWYVEPRKYALPAPVDWTPSTTTLQVASKCELDAPRWLHHAITLTRDQLYWYETTRAYYARKGDLGKFLKEYPSDDQECFQYAGRSIFTLEQLETIDEAGSRRKLLDVWAVEPAREIAELRSLPEDDPDHVPTDRSRMPVPLAPRVPGSTSPVAPDTHPVPPGFGFRRLTPAQLAALPSLRASVLAIYEYPRARGPRSYVISADVSDGLGLDYSSVDVIRLPTIEEPAEQVAHYHSNVVDPKHLAFVIDAIGRYYQDADGIEALAAIETNNHGLSTQDTLQLHLGYGHFYVWEVADAASPEKRRTTKIGWYTTPRTRPLLLSAFHDAILAIDPITLLPDFILNSPITRGELRHFVTPDVLANAEAARGQHDDAILSAAIGYYVAWRLAGGESEPIAERRRRRSAQQHQQTEADRRIGHDWRNSAVTAEEADLALEDDDEFRDDLGGDGALHFSGRATDGESE